MIDALLSLSRDEAIGYAAAFCTTSAFLPQAYVAIKHRDTKSLSLAMYIIFVTGLVLWLIYGIVKNDWALIASNSITVTLAGLILLTKLRYDTFPAVKTKMLSGKRARIFAGKGIKLFRRTHSLNKELNMKLIGSLTSPFVRKIRVALIEKNIPFELIVDLPLEPETKVPNYNPLGKVPVLIANDGSVWYDSDLLIEYLEVNFPEAPLLPQDRRAALAVRKTLVLADGVGDAAVLVYLEKRRSADKQDLAWISRQLGKVERGLTELENLARGKIYLHNDMFSVADITVGSILLWLDLRIPELQWRVKYPALFALSERLSERQSFQQTVPVV